MTARELSELLYRAFLSDERNPLDAHARSRGETFRKEMEKREPLLKARIRARQR